MSSGCLRSLHMNFMKPAKSIWVPTLIDGKSLSAATGWLEKQARARSAPIGAQVFVFERRNHSKTGVYGILCMRVSVDTTSPVDKLKKAKKSLKFERFDVLFQPIGSSLGQWGPEDRTERGAARMCGLSFDSVSPSRSLQSQTRTLRFASGPAPSALDMPSVAPLRKSKWSPQVLGIPSLLHHFPFEPHVLVPPLFRVPQRCGRAGSNLPGSELKTPDALFQSGRKHSGRKQSADKRAQPLATLAFDPIECGTAFAAWAG